MPTRPTTQNSLHAFSTILKQWQKDNLENRYTSEIPVKDASKEGNVVIAGRPKVLVSLLNCLALDIGIHHFDVDITHDLMALCGGKVVYLFRISSFELLKQFGRADGGAHKGDLNYVTLDSQAALIASAGEDKRIAIWNVKSGTSEKVFEGHQGVIYQVEFSRDSSQIISCSEDGTVLIWNWRKGQVLKSFMKHPSAVRAFDFHWNSPSVYYCGRNDGYLTVWNSDFMLRMDNIAPKDQWQLQENIQMAFDPKDGHSGGILCTKVSPSGWLLATGSDDSSCKIWNILSHRKHMTQVQKEMQENEDSVKELSACIDITDPKFDPQTDTKERSCLMLGQVKMADGYHSELLQTLKHNAPVMSVCFSLNSAIVITGTADSKCSLWSSWRGDLLFQINTTAPVQSIFVVSNTSFYCSCLNRLLVFDYHVKAKESKLRDLLPIAENVYKHQLKKSNDFKLEVVDGMDMNATPTGALFDQGRLNTSSKDKNKNRSMTIEEREQEEHEAELNAKYEAAVELSHSKHHPHKANIDLRPVKWIHLKKLVSAGLLKNSAFETMISHSENVNPEQLIKNMTKFHINPRQVFRILVSNQYPPNQILSLLSKNTTEVSVLYSMVTRGTPVAGYLNNIGLKPLSQNGTAESKRDTIILSKKDVEPVSKKNAVVSPGPNEAFDYENWFAEWWNIEPQAFSPTNKVKFGLLQDTNSDDEDDEEDIEWNPELDYRMGLKSETGNASILHFNPAMQRRLLQDLQSSKPMKSIFLRQLLIESETGTRFPNFRPEDEISLTMDSVNRTARSVPRFNERNFGKPNSKYLPSVKDHPLLISNQQTKKSTKSASMEGLTSRMNSKKVKETDMSMNQLDMKARKNEFA